MLRSIAGAVVGEIIGRKRGHGLLGAGIGLVATRIATRSVPGLILVGGAIAAKALYDRRKPVLPQAATPKQIKQSEI
jgi:hypothetical protein